MRSRLACTIALGFLALAALGEGAARANEVAAQLDYVSVSDCPAAADFEEIVAEHLGYSPFREDAPQRVIVRIEASGRGLEGLIEWRNESGGWAGERTFPSRNTNCGELVRAMGFAIALQFQLLAAAQAGAPRTAEPPPAPRAQTEPAAPPTLSVSPVESSGHAATAKSTREPPSIVAGAGAAAGVGSSPNVAALGRLFGTVAWPHLAVELAAEASVPSTLHRADGAGFSQHVLLAGLAGCGVSGRWSGCLLAKAGQIRVTGEGVDMPGTASGLFLQTGLRVAVTQALGHRAQLMVHADGLASLVRGIVTLDSMPVWTTPRVAATAGIDFGVRFQ
jgi:hypothetical protein